jgi:nucleoid-associated protein YgaU
MSRIFFACENGTIKFSTYVLEEAQRLDQLAGVAYQSSTYWWVIAAASGIGWGLQVPPGTVLRIPRNLSEVLGYIQ